MVPLTDSISKLQGQNCYIWNCGDEIKRKVNLHEPTLQLNLWNRTSLFPYEAKLNQTYTLFPLLGGADPWGLSDACAVQDHSILRGMHRNSWVLLSTPTCYFPLTYRLHTYNLQNWKSSRISHNFSNQRRYKYQEYPLWTIAHFEIGTWTLFLTLLPTFQSSSDCSTFLSKLKQYFCFFDCIFCNFV